MLLFTYKDWLLHLTYAFLKKKKDHSHILSL